MLRLDDREWKVFPLTGEDGLFPIHATSTGVDGIKLKEGKDAALPYITRTETNNGIARFISSVNLEYGKDEGGCITIGLDTQTAYWQPVDFITGQNIHVLRSNKLNYFSYQFLTVILRQQMKSKFNWGGNGATLGRLKKLKIMLPVTDDGQPDYQFMEDYVRELMSAKREQYRRYVEKRLESLGLDVANSGGYSEALKSRKWAEFFLEDLFTVSAGKRLTNADKIDGSRPFIGATDNNNGITGFVDNKNSSLDWNVLGVNYNGAPCIGFYHPYECIFTDDVKRLHLKNHEDNPYILLFMKAVILQQRTKYNYGYKFNENRMLRQLLSVPVTVDGKPDYDFMEEFGRKMMSNKYNQYLAFLAMSDTVKAE